jgi:hypothetical protein
LPHVQHDLDDDSAYDERGILRDGHAIRVPMREMRDANRSNAPVVITTGLRLDREFYPDGTPRYRRDDDPQPRRRRKVQQTDPTVTEDDHRPGHRFGDAAGRATVDAAYNEMVADLTSAWMSAEQRAQNASDAQRVTADGVSPRDQYIRSMQDAWRTPPVVFDANGPEVAATTRAVPDRPQGAWGPAGFAAKAGDPCTSNGAPGVRREKDGWLYCELTPVGPTRSSETVNPGDSMTVDIAAAQKIRDAAYAEYVQRISQEWRTVT